MSVSESESIEKLPEPEHWLVRPPSRNAAAAARYREVENELLRRYRSFRIVATKQMPSGDIYDWVDPATIPGSDEPPPPKPEGVAAAGVELAKSELEMFPELEGPTGTVPLVRPSFERYVSGESDAESLGEFVRKQVTGQPATPGRLYGGYPLNKNNHGLAASVNAWERGYVTNGTMVLHEIATYCGGLSNFELVGATHSRDRANFSDSKLRFQIEFLTAGLNGHGNNVGGWIGNVTGFTVASGGYSPGFVISPTSTVGGTQYDRYMEIKWFNGNWWVYDNDTWMGYFDGSLFDVIDDRGCWLAWYGEVYSSGASVWNGDNMGSGLFSGEGFGRAAYYRNPRYRNTSSSWVWPSPPSHMGPMDTDCYDVGSIQVGTGSWARSFFFGGPGDGASACKN